MLDGKLWLTEIGNSTHYHAYWVHPCVGQRDAQALQDRRAQLLSPARWGDGAEVAEPVRAPVATDEPSEELQAADHLSTSFRQSEASAGIQNPVSVIIEIGMDSGSRLRRAPE